MKKSENLYMLLIPSVIFDLVLVFDRLSKFLVIEFDISHHYNENFAFGFGEFSKEIVMFLVASSIIFTTLFLSVIIKSSSKNSSKRKMVVLWGLFAAILSASISNFVDRLLYTGVLDFINLPFIPTFNLADAIISIGIFLLITIYFFENVDQKNFSS